MSLATAADSVQDSATQGTKSEVIAPASRCPFHALFADPGTARPAAGRRVDFAGTATMAYGLLAYASFFGTIVYAIGFVGNWLVPKSIDSGPAAAWVEALAVNGGILVLFVIQHTVMARRWFKDWWTRIVPEAIERSTFVLAASAILALLFWQWRPLPAVVWQTSGPVAWVLTGISLLGWATVFASSFMVSHWELFGLRQTFWRLTGRTYEPVGFRLVGLYKLVRHPLMVGFLLAFWAAPVMTEGHLLFAVLTTGYIVFGVWMEERDLRATHGEDYRAYCDRVRAFVPIPKRAGRPGDIMR